MLTPAPLLNVTVVAALPLPVTATNVVAEVALAPPTEVGAAVVLAVALPLATEELAVFPYDAQNFNTSCNLSATVAFFALQHSSHYRQI